MTKPLESLRSRSLPVLALAMAYSRVMQRQRFKKPEPLGSPEQLPEMPAQIWLEWML